MFNQRLLGTHLPSLKAITYERVSNMSNNLEIVIQIFIAAVLGGIVGYERERLKRPAGLRTHILVCVGSTIAMQTNIFFSSRVH